MNQLYAMQMNGKMINHMCMQMCGMSDCRKKTIMDFYLYRL